MIRIDKEIMVNATVEEIFSYIREIRNWPEFWPSLIELGDIQSLPNGGYRATYNYKMAGIHFSGKGVYTRVAPNFWIIVETENGIQSQIAWTFRSKCEKTTRVTLTIDYTIPIPLLGKLAEVIILKMNEQEADLLLANIQARFMLNE